ncbi:MAG: hypothetical protein NTY12_03600 [Candidatus Falkowbacteria bacterium]|nr:hypothetical protein [Candidatus Falkowbacteria bacterium]
MRCPNCQKLILNNTSRCPYCGQSTTAVQATANKNPNSMFGNNTMPTPAGIPPAEHHEAVAKEVSKRHWQRWFFYFLIVALFLGAVGLIIKIYNDNTKLLLDITQTKDQLTKVTDNLSKKEAEVKQIDESLKKVQDDLNVKAEQYKKDIETQAGSVKDLEQCKLQLTSSDANIYNLILTLGSGATSGNLRRIALADANLANGPDTDQDGLSDEIEQAVGTDINKADTDADGFSDKQELLTGFDPLVAKARLPIDQKYADQQRGNILINITGGKDAWYVGPADGKLYFLGHPGDAYKAMRSIQFWTKDYKNN